MADYITGFKTAKGVKQIDYNKAIANLPDIAAMTSGASKGALNCGTAGIRISKGDYSAPLIPNKTWQYAVEIEAPYDFAKIGRCLIYSLLGPRVIMRLDYLKQTNGSTGANTWFATVLEGSPDDDAGAGLIFATVVDPFYYVSCEVQSSGAQVIIEGNSVGANVFLSFNCLVRNFDIQFPYISNYYDIYDLYDISNVLPHNGATAATGAVHYVQDRISYTVVNASKYGVKAVVVEDFTTSKIVSVGLLKSEGAATGQAQIRTIIPGIGMFSV